MKTILFIILIFFFQSLAFAIELQKPAKYRSSIDYTGWVMSEKYDGIRAIWDTNQLKTRKGNVIHAPQWFLKQLPPFSIDGELWTKRQDLEKIQSIVMTQTPSKHFSMKQWKKIKYFIFEIPNTPGNLYARYHRLQNWLKSIKDTPVRVIEQIKITSKEHLDSYYLQLIGQGAEGIIIKNPNLEYFGGRTTNSLKRKPIYDLEGLVISINAGKGKFSGMMGSLKLQLANGKTFNLGTGFSDKLRKNPPKIGSYVKFKYYGYTKKGIPRHASFIMIRED